MKKTLVFLMLLLMLCMGFCATAGASAPTVQVPQTEKQVLLNEYYEIAFTAEDAIAWAVYCSTSESGNDWYPKIVTVPGADKEDYWDIDELPDLTQEQIDAMSKEETFCRKLIIPYDHEKERRYCARAYIPGVGWSRKSEEISVTTTCLGNLEEPEIEFIGELEKGEAVRVRVTLPAGTQEYKLTFDSAEFGSDKPPYETDWIAVEDGQETLEYTLPAQYEESGEMWTLVDAIGKTYYIDVCARKAGYSLSSGYVDGSSVAKQYITVPQTEKQVLLNEYYEIAFTAEDAIAWAVYGSHSSNPMAVTVPNANKEDYWDIEELPDLTQEQIDAMSKEETFCKRLIIPDNHELERWYCARAYIPGVGWSRKSEVIHVSATCLGALEEPEIEIIGEIEKGEAVRVRVTLPAGTQEYRFIFDSYNNSDDPLYKTDWIAVEDGQETLEYTIPAQYEASGETRTLVDAVGEMYYIEIWARKAGYGLSSNSVEGRSVAKQYITVPQTEKQVLLNERFEIAFTAEDATAWAVYYSKDDPENRADWNLMAVTVPDVNEDDYWDINRLPNPTQEQIDAMSKGETFCGKSSITESDYLERWYCARAYIPGVGWSRKSEVIHVSATYLGDLEKPKIEIIGEIVRGESVRVRVTLPAGTQEYYLIFDSDGSPYVSSRIAVEDGQETIEYTFPAQFEKSGETLELVSAVGEEYEVSAYARRAGYTTSSNSVVGRSVENRNIKVPNKEITVLTETNYDVVFRHPKALAWVVFEKRSGSENWINYATADENDWNELYEVEYGGELPVPSAEMLAGLRTMAEARFIGYGRGAGQREYRAMAYLPDGWTELSESMTVDVVAPNGKLPQPTVELIGKLEEGKSVKVAYSIPAEATQCRISIMSGDGTRFVSEEIECDGQAKQGEYTFDATIENGDGEETILVSKDAGSVYEINLFVAAEGYEASNMLIRSAIWTPMTIICQSTVMTNEAFKITGCAPEATAVRLYKFTTEDGVFNLLLKEEAGTEASYEISGLSQVGKAWFALSALIDDEWSEMSKAHTVEVVAPYGKLPVQNVELPEAYHEGADIVIPLNTLDKEVCFRLATLFCTTGGKFEFVKSFDSEDNCFTVPGRLLTEGEKYRLVLTFGGRGYEEYVKEVEFEVSQPLHRVTITGPSTALVNGDAEFTVNAPGATEIELYSVSPSGDKVMMRSATTEMLAQSVSSKEAQTMQFVARAKIDGEWTDYSEVYELAFTAPYGEMPEQTVTLPASRVLINTIEGLQIQDMDEFCAAARVQILEKDDEGNYTLVDAYDFDSTGFARVVYDKLVDGRTYVMEFTFSGVGYTPCVIRKELRAVAEPETYGLKLPNGIREIEESAFEGNTAIRSVYCPETLESIGPNAFAGCTQLDIITVPGSARIDDTALDKDVIVLRY